MEVTRQFLHEDILEKIVSCLVTTTFHLNTSSRIRSSNKGPQVDSYDGSSCGTTDVSLGKATIVVDSTWDVVKGALQ